MLEFMPVTAENITNALPLFREAEGRVCDDTAGVTWQWRNLFQTRIAMTESAVMTCSVFPGAGACYSVPAGRGDSSPLFTLAEREAEKTGEPLRFACVDDIRLRRLEARYGKDRLYAEPRRSWDDYLYAADNFEYRGKHLHGQRNHVNRFYAVHPEARLVPVTKENAPLVSAFLDKVVADHPEMSGWERGETEGTRDLLFMADKLQEKAAYLEISTGVAAFSMGEVQGDTLYVHAEKADTSVPGAYPAMAQAFARYAADGAVYVNREDDAGDEGIRKSKEQYKPLLMVEKYLVTVKR